MQPDHKELQVQLDMMELQALQAQLDQLALQVLKDHKALSDILVPLELPDHRDPLVQLVQ